MRCRIQKLFWFCFVVGVYVLSADGGEGRPMGKSVGLNSEPGVERVRLTAMQQKLAAAPRLKADAYIRAGILVVERFLSRLENGSQEYSYNPNWRTLQCEEVHQVLDQVQRRIECLLDSRDLPWATGYPSDPWVGIKSGELLVRPGPMARDPLRPFFFYGYGHFDEARKDLQNFHTVGATLIQQEIGPGQGLNSDGSLTSRAKAVVDMLKEASAAGVKVDLLLSPHYFPDWVAKEDPEIMNASQYHFLRYQISHPRAREVIEHFLDKLIPLVKDEPSLLSFCLSNEPIYTHSGRDRYSRPAWTQFLRARHGEIEKLNRLYGTRYSSFETVPVPPLVMPAPSEILSMRAFYDWGCFNQQYFADWHHWMHTIVKKHAPNIPTHSKVMGHFFNRLCFGAGIDPELMVQTTDLAGNDCEAYLSSEGPYVYQWQEEIWYDLQYSFRHQPVFNSENHLIPDRTTSPVPADHTRAVLWQGGLHHQYATTIWVWSIPDSPKSDFEGCIYLRPANVYAAARAMLDLNRWSMEVSAINQEPAKIAVFHSMSSLFWQEGFHDTVNAAYAAVNFLGQPVTFVSERQLASRNYNGARWILVPQVTHVSPAALTGLAEFARKGGKVVLIRPGCLSWDEYHRPQALPAPLEKSFAISDWKSGSELSKGIRTLLLQNGMPLVSLTNTDNGQPSWGIEYRVVKQVGKNLVPLINLLRSPQTMKLAIKGSARDLLSGQTVNLDKMTLVPMVPVLLEIR